VISQAAKSRECSEINSNVFLVLPLYRLSSPRARSIHVAEPDEPDEPVAEMPNQMLEEEFNVRFEEDPKRNCTIKRKYDSRELSKEFRMTPKGVLSQDLYFQGSR
jgi:hypothetical protein